MDELMKAHYSRIYGDGADGSDTTGVNDQNESKRSKDLDPVNSQECVGCKGYVGSRMKNGPQNNVAGSVRLTWRGNS